MSSRSREMILASAREQLAMAVSGLTDLASRDPRRRRPGLMNVATYGRSVTFVLQGLRSHDEGFDDWYQPRVDDPLLSFFKHLRNNIEKRGELGVTNLAFFTSVDIISLTRALQQHAPPNTRGTFFGDRLGGNGWEVEMPDGTIERVYFDLPPESGVQSRLEFTDPPTEHRGAPIADPSIEALAELYVRYLGELIEEAAVRFQGG